MSEQEASNETVKYSPWQILNERDKGQIVAHFLHGLSPAQIATLTTRSLPFVYEVLKSEEAQVAIAAFENERQQGLSNVNERLAIASVGLLDGLLDIAMNGKREGNKLKAIIEGLGMAGVSRVQRVQTEHKQVIIHAGKIDLALKVMQEEAAMEGEIVGGGNGNSDGKPLLQQVRDSLNATGPGGVFVAQLDASDGPPSGLASEVPKEYLLPGEGGAWIRQDDGLSPSPTVQASPGSQQETKVDSVAEGTLQKHPGDKVVSDLAAHKRPEHANPYYQRDGN